MPIYEYQCVDCGTVRDIKHGFKEQVDDVCAQCGGALKRLFNAASIVFKGSGFYVTDSRKASGAAGEKTGATSSDGKADGTAKSDSAAKSDTGTKSEPAAKSDAGPKSDSGSKSGTGGKSDAAA